MDPASPRTIPVAKDWTDLLTQQATALVTSRHESNNNSNNNNNNRKTRKQIRAHLHFHSSRIGTIVAAHINEYLALGRTTDFQSRYQRHGKDQESERISPFHRSMVNPPLSANHSAPPLLYSSVSNLRFYHDSIGTRRRLHSSSTRTTMPSTIVHFEITRAEYKTRLITFPMDGLPSHANGHPLVRRMGGKSTSDGRYDSNEHTARALSLPSKTANIAHYHSYAKRLAIVQHCAWYVLPHHASVDGRTDGFIRNTRRYWKSFPPLK